VAPVPGPKTAATARRSSSAQAQTIVARAASRARPAARGPSCSQGWRRPVRGGPSTARALAVRRQGGWRPTCQAAAALLAYRAGPGTSRSAAPGGRGRLMPAMIPAVLTWPRRTCTGAASLTRNCCRTGTSWSAVTAARAPYSSVSRTPARWPGRTPWPPAQANAITRRSLPLPNGQTGVAGLLNTPEAMDVDPRRNWQGWSPPPAARAVAGPAVPARWRLCRVFGVRRSTATRCPFCPGAGAPGLKPWTDAPSGPRVHAVPLSRQTHAMSGWCCFGSGTVTVVRDAGAPARGGRGPRRGGKRGGSDGRKHAALRPVGCRFHHRIESRSPWPDDPGVRGSGRVAPAGAPRRRLPQDGPRS